MLRHRGLVNPQQVSDVALGATAEVVEPQAVVLAWREALGHRFPHRTHPILDESVAGLPFPLLLPGVLILRGRAHDRVQVEGVEGDLLVEMVGVATGGAGHVRRPPGFSRGAVRVGGRK